MKSERSLRQVFLLAGLAEELSWESIGGVKCRYMAMADLFDTIKSSQGCWALTFNASGNLIA